MKQSPAQLYVRPLQPDGDAIEFMGFLDMLQSLDDGFYHNRVALLNAYIGGTFNVICDRYEDTPRAEIVGDPPHDASGVPFLSADILPAFYAVGCDILWVHPDYRRRGYGTLLVNELGITKVGALTEALPFWTAMGFVHVEPHQHGYAHRMERGQPRRSKRLRLLSSPNPN